MNRILPVIVLVLVPFLLTAQSVLITPGAQSINGDSTNQDQLNVFGNGLLVGPKVELTEDDPASNVHTMSCASGIENNSLAGTLKDPSGDADYSDGMSYDCSFSFSASNNPLFQAYQIDFEFLDTEADGDTVYVEDYYSGEILGLYSGNSLPTSLLVNNQYIRIKFKTDNDANIGAGFVLKWQAIMKSVAVMAVQNYTGEGLVYDVETNALWAGKHSLLEFENKGSYSTALGYSTVASGDFSTALGTGTVASGGYTTALGNNTTASGYFSTALGQRTTASGYYSTAMGERTTASGERSTAMGSITSAAGYTSTALGFGTVSLGNYSIAMGYSTFASESYSIALGRSTEALGVSSTALGQDAVASGYTSTAMGYSTVASGYTSTAMGYSTVASGYSSTALGRSTESSAYYSTAMGFKTIASGNYSTAIGFNTVASGGASTAIGTQASTNGYIGAMVLSDYVDSTGDSLKADARDRFLARFDNGYKLYTNNDLSASSIGLMALHNANSWSSISDSTRKENFIASNGEDVLKSVSQMRIGTWNYKGQNANMHRHWGVMAQDFHHHFGKDAYGTIGNDTTIATADFDGVSFAAIKALEARTRELQDELENERRFSASLKAVTDDLRKDVGAYASRIEKLEAKLEEHASLKSDFKELKEMLLKSVAVKED